MFGFSVSPATVPANNAAASAATMRIAVMCPGRSGLPAPAGRHDGPALTSPGRGQAALESEHRVGTIDLAAPKLRRRRNPMPGQEVTKIRQGSATPAVPRHPPSLIGRIRSSWWSMSETAWAGEICSSRT